MVAGIDPAKLPDFYLPSQERLSPRNDWKQAIKPLSHLLALQEENGKWNYYALTEVGARFYVGELAKLKVVNYPKTRAFVAAFGQSVLATTFTLTHEECLDQLNTKRFKQMVSLLNLSVGRAFDSIDFVTTLHDLKWTRRDYRAFCQYIRTSTPPDEDFAPEKYERELFG